MAIISVFESKHTFNVTRVLNTTTDLELGGKKLFTLFFSNSFVEAFLAVEFQNIIYNIPLTHTVSTAHLYKVIQKIIKVLY